MVRPGKKADPGKKLSQHLPKKTLRSLGAELGQTAILHGDKMIRVGTLRA